MRRALAALALLVALAGCATLPPPAPTHAGTPPAPAAGTPPATPAPGTPVGTTASGGTISLNGAPPAGAHAPAGVDSTPSPEAVAVLNTIPEPLGGTSASRPGGPAGASAGASPAAPAAAPATAGASPATPSAAPAPAGAAASDSAAVPVPEPTQPLGDRPGSVAALPESLMAAAPAASADTTHAPAAATSPDSCWRVQVAAPPVKGRADRMAEAARSQLLIAVVVEKEAGLYKVRTRDCYSAAAAEDLKRRAVGSGFEGAFRFLKKAR